MAKQNLHVIVDHGTLDVELEHCIRHDEWYTGGCQQCTVDLMQAEKDVRYDEGYEAGKAVRNG